MSSSYHKIHSLYKRDMGGSKKLLVGQWSRPEFAYLADSEWTFHEKLDGMNVRVWAEEGQLRIGGRTDNAVIPEPLSAHLRSVFLPVLDKLGGMTIYGEGFGGKIQKGGKYWPSQIFAAFDVRTGGGWLPQEDASGFCAALGIRYAPSLGTGTLHEAVEWVMRGLPSAYGGFEAEGIIARPLVELSDRRGERIIAKIKGCDYR